MKFFYKMVDDGKLIESIIIKDKNPKPKNEQNTKTNINRIIDYCKRERVDAILMNARYDRFYPIANICKKKAIPLYVESCEWYHFSNFKMKFLDYRYWLNQQMILPHFFQFPSFL